ncbi:MAG: outer membrane protein assembly factor BamA, partial [Bacteroidales bacterium]|nr:outer membrane protein assembly factor BamA [Bacteroidales bacterium]
VEGITYLREAQIVSLTGLAKGYKIQVPGEQVSSAVRRIMMQRKFSDVALYIDSLSENKDTCFFVLKLQERPRVSRWLFTGMKNSEKSDLQERLKLRRGGEVSDYVIKSSTDIIKRYYSEKGFLKAEVDVKITNDTVIKNAVKVTFDVDRGPKVRMQRINLMGFDDQIKEGKLRKALKKTKDKRLRNFFNSKKFNEKEYEMEKEGLIDVFNEAGFRDAKIAKDSLYYITEDRLGLDIHFDQGNKYYFRDVTWTGNSIYSAE